MKKHLFRLITGIVLASSLLAFTTFSTPTNVLAQQPPSGEGGTIPREYGTNARVWAGSWHLGKCTSTTQNDWIVSFNVNQFKKQWSTASVSRMRYYASSSSLVRWYPALGSAVVKRATPGGVTLCLSSGNGLIKPNDIKGMWIWLD